MVDSAGYCSVLWSLEVTCHEPISVFRSASRSLLMLESHADALHLSLRQSQGAALFGQPQSATS